MSVSTILKTCWHCMRSLSKGTLTPKKDHAEPLYHLAATSEPEAAEAAHASADDLIPDVQPVRAPHPLPRCPAIPRPLTPWLWSQAVQLPHAQDETVLQRIWSDKFQRSRNLWKAIIAVAVVSVAAMLYGLHTWLMHTEGALVPAVYNETEAAQYLQYARATFCDADVLEAWACGICSSMPIAPSSVRFLGPGANFDVQGYLALMPAASNARSERQCIAAFRGSVDLRNWESDALFFPSAWPPSGTDCDLPGSHRCTPLEGTSKNWCPGCEVHTGFGAAYSDLRPQLFQAILELGCTDVALAGHSLGAAVASLAALELRVVMGFQASPLYLFGLPRVGNDAFVKEFRRAAQERAVDPPAWRVVHYQDPVPRIVPTIKPFAYQHFPTEVYYPTEDERGYRVCDRQNGEDPTCMNSVSFEDCVTSLDHLTYLNLSLTSETFPEPCIAQGR